MKPITIIVETPKGSTQKYDYEFKIKCFKLNKILPEGMQFPFDFGFIPGTKGGDGDPLDVVVISEFKSFPGCAIDVKIIGGLIAEQSEKNGKKVRNDRYLAVPLESALFKDVDDIKALPGDIINQLEDFFKNYNRAAGKEFEVKERIGGKKAFKIINK